MRLFQGDDADYLAWVQHPNGFIINAERRPSPSHLILHRSDCTHITRASQSGRWTTAYIKVCAAEVAELGRWLGQGDSRWSPPAMPLVDPRPIPHRIRASS
jgi:hypothetical protein